MIATSSKGFLTNPAMRWMEASGPITQQLLEPLIYVSGRDERFEVPAGFVTDYASVPRIFWNIIAPDGDARFPAVLHDYLYSLRGHEPFNKSRSECDSIFLEAMQFVGVDLIQRNTIYYAVRLFGGFWSMGKNAEGRTWAK
jgi:Protein of unknown function (DUF1353)